MSYDWVAIEIWDTEKTLILHLIWDCIVCIHASILFNPLKLETVQSSTQLLL